MGVLKLAKKWDLAGLRDKAVQQSDTQIQLKDPIEKILLARKYNVVKWLKEAYTTLASREHVLTADEIDQIGWETFGRLMMVRERRWRVPEPEPEATGHCDDCGCDAYVTVRINVHEAPPFDYATAIEDVFIDNLA